LPPPRQRFIPQYGESGALAKLRGYLSGSRWLAFGIATSHRAHLRTPHYVARPWLDDYNHRAAAARLRLPAGLRRDACAGRHRAVVQLGQSCAGARLHRAPARRGGADGRGWFAVRRPMRSRRDHCRDLDLGDRTRTNASSQSQAQGQIEDGAKAYEIKAWFAMSIPMFAVDSLYSMLMYVDVLVLNNSARRRDRDLLRGAQNTVARRLRLFRSLGRLRASFRGVSCGGRPRRLDGFLRDAVRWTSGPRSARRYLLLACGWPMLWLFGKGFTAGYHLMFIFAIGYSARSSIGPANVSW
jgi:hypothetical protein